MIRFWITFKFTEASDLPAGVAYGLGVTAPSQDAALAIVADDVFGGEGVAPIREIIENVDVSTLDAGHVLPNMGNCLTPGVWFPKGYST